MLKDKEFLLGSFSIVYEGAQKACFYPTIIISTTDEALPNIINKSSAITLTGTFPQGWCHTKPCTAWCCNRERLRLNVRTKHLNF